MKHTHLLSILAVIIIWAGAAFLATLPPLQILGTGVIAGFLSYGAALFLNSKYFMTHFTPISSPQALGFVRIVVGIAAFVRLFELHFEGNFLISEEFRVSMGVMDILYIIPGFEFYAHSQFLLFLTKILVLLFLVFVIIGYKTKIFMLGSIFLWIIAGGIARQYSYFFNHGMASLYLLCLLFFLPCHHGLALDAKKKRPASREYGASLISCWIVFALLMVSAGLNKLRNTGWEWWQPHFLKSKILFAPYIIPTDFRWGIDSFLLHTPNWVFLLLGVFVVIMQLTFILVLFSSTARVVYPISHVLFQLGTFLVMNITFKAFIVLQFIYLNIDKILKRKLPSKNHHINFFPVFFSIFFLISATWMAPLEFYPLDSLPMFSEKGEIPKSTLYLVAHTDSQEMFLPYTYFFDTLGAIFIPHLQCPNQKYHGACVDMFSKAAKVELKEGIRVQEYGLRTCILDVEKREQRCDSEDFVRFPVKG